MSKPKTEQKTDAKVEATEIPKPTSEREAKAVKIPKGKKPARPAKKKRERKPKEENLVVFAFRLTPEERDAIHAAAGPGGASRFVRAVAIAAANEDEAAIRGAIKEARERR